MMRPFALLVLVAVIAGCNSGNSPTVITVNPQTLYVGNSNLNLFALPFTSVEAASPQISGFGIVVDVAADQAGHLFVLDDGPTPPVIFQYNRPITPTQAQTAQIAVTGTVICTGLTVDVAGNLWVGCTNRVVEIAGPFTATGSYNATIAATLNASSASSLTFDAAGNLFVSDSNVLIFKAPVQNLNSPSGSLSVSAPSGIAIDAAGNVYVSAFHTLSRWNAPISTTTIGRTADAFIPTSSAGSAISFDSSGNLYVGDCGGLQAGVALFNIPTSGFTFSTAPAFTNFTTGCPGAVKIAPR